MDFPRYPPKRRKDKLAGKLRLVKYESKSKGRGILISLRINEQLKESLKTNAARRGQTLTYMLTRILKDFLKSYESGSHLEEIQKERRNHQRKKIILPARWRFRRRKDQVEKSVLVKNICAGGAYTEYINGKTFSFLKNLQGSTFSLVVRMPGSQKAVELDSLITEESVGVALRFISTLDEGSLIG